MEQRLPGEDEEEDILPSNPIERIDAKIAELADSVVDMNILKENVVKLKYCKCQGDLCKEGHRREVEGVSPCPKF